MKKLSFIKNPFKGLARDQSGVALVEFALSVPVFLFLGLYGSETAYLANANMKLSQTALNVADNASRLGQASNGVPSPTITDADIKTLFAGAKLEGDDINVLNTGRIILSSLEVKTVAGVEQQYIHWRRCKGLRVATTKYSDDLNNDGVTDTTFTGMGPATAKIQAVSGSAVMFVEIEYQYTPLFNNLFYGTGTQKASKSKFMNYLKLKTPPILTQDAAFNIRDNRNLGAGLFNNIGAASPVCTVYSAT